MNNKGFTLIEVVLTICFVSIVFIISIINVSGTFGLSDKKAYDAMKKAIITQVNEYVYECDNGLIKCENDYLWEEYNDIEITSFKLDVMLKYAYFSNDSFINPITKENINECMIIYVTKDSYATINVELDDSRCLK